jgi:hypothetical protein
VSAFGYRGTNREADMRLSFVWLCVLAAGSAMAPTIGGAGADECCGRPLPKVVYGLPPVPMAIPPTGYVLDPSDAARPVYPVDPYATGAAPFARPTYSEGGYAYADSYPYTDDPYGYGSQGYGPPAYGPYGPQAYGPYGSSAPAPNYDPPGPGYYRGLYVRPWGAPPYTAYRYRVAPSAKIIHLRPRE